MFIVDMTPSTPSPPRHSSLSSSCSSPHTPPMVLDVDAVRPRRPTISTDPAKYAFHPLVSPPQTHELLTPFGGRNALGLHSHLRCAPDRSPSPPFTPSTVLYTPVSPRSPYSQLHPRRPPSHASHAYHPYSHSRRGTITSPLNAKPHPHHRESISSNTSTDAGADRLTRRPDTVEAPPTNPTADNQQSPLTSSRSSYLSPEDGTGRSAPPRSASPPPPRGGGSSSSEGRVPQRVPQSHSHHQRQSTRTSSSSISSTLPTPSTATSPHNAASSIPRYHPYYSQPHRRPYSSQPHTPYTPTGKYGAAASPVASMNPQDQYGQQRANSAPAPASPPLWSPNIFYPLGALVWHAGSVWRCDSPHTSGSLAREPNQSLHLWTPVGSNLAYGPAHGQNYGGSSQQLQRPATAPASDADRGRMNALREDQDAARNIEALQDELRGAHVWRVGGVGILAYNEDLEVERTRRGLWKEYAGSHDKDDWINAARARTASYVNAEQHGQLRPLVRWQLVEGDAPVPHDALIVGQEKDGKNLYASRIWHSNGLHVGKAADHLFKRCEYSWGGRTWAPDTNAFEVLCGPPDVVEWIPFEAGTAANQPGWQPVEGGREADGRALLVARGTHDGSVQPGKIQVDATTCMIPYGGQEVHIRPFQVLAYASYNRR